MQQKFKIFIFALATVKNTVADIDTKATAKNCFDEENLSETECRQEREVVNTGSLYHFERRNCTMSRSQIFENEFLEGAVNQKWLARWVGLGTTVARKAIALEAERFGGPKGKNESKNRM
ncbi:hypothetical protein [Fibrobacter sp. UWB10]|uniref:hypothetical protein n=1 Tax=Fibrobacter sp. UWB10 TaxID=1896201 RepID=UPI0024B76034|nr:hypothetical protein [Fibrobacter sp. UWB10]